MPVTADTLRLQELLAAQLGQVLDAQTRHLTRAWVEAWNEVAPDLRNVLLDMLVSGDRVTRAQMLRSVRLQRALAIIAARLQQLADQAGVRVSGDLQAVIDTAGAAQASIIDSQLPPNAAQLVDLDAWSRVDPTQIEAIVTRTLEQITALTRPLSAEAYTAIRRELIRGVAAGSNPRLVADRIMQRVERRFNGGLTRALVISRTEILDAHRKAAEVAQAQHADVLAGWMWLAKLDTRTCPSCWARHGGRHDLSEPGPHDHQQGRCARMAVTKPWAELGFDVEEPPSLAPDAATVFAQLPAGAQRSILGPKRHAAWLAGEFPMGSWSVRRTTSGWRDSFGVAPAPSQRGGRRSPNAA